MDLFEISEACMKMGLPMAILSWFMFSWLHKEGKLDVAGDRKAVEAELKRMKDSHKTEKANQAKQRKQDKTSLKEKFRNSYFARINEPPKKSDGNDKQTYIFDRWMWFGSGFYGLAALWTLMVVEVMDVINFVATFPGLGTLFEKGVVNLVVELGVNQITNIFSAFAWFTFWTQQAVHIWMLVAYLGYLAGMKLAQFQSVR